MNDLERLRKSYNKIKVPSFLVENGWNDIKDNLGKQEKSYQYIPKKPFAFAAFAVVIIISIAVIVQYLNPGQNINLVETLTDKLKNREKQVQDQVIKEENKLPTTIPTPTEKPQEKLTPTPKSEIIKAFEEGKQRVEDFIKPHSSPTPEKREEDEDIKGISNQEENSRERGNGNKKDKPDKESRGRNNERPK